jgi:hypothetical protein
MTIDATLARRIAQLEEAPSPARGVLQLLLDVGVENPASATRPQPEARRPVGKRSRQPVDSSAASNHALRTALRDVILRGQAFGEFDAIMDLEQACDLILAVMEGMAISAGSGASVEACSSTARLAVKRLSARQNSRWT